MALDGTEGDTEVYEDCWDDDAQTAIPDTAGMPSLNESVEATLKTLDLFLDNRFQEGLDLMTPWAHCSIYHALGKGTILFIQAVLTLNPDDINVAYEALKNGVVVCNRRRRKGAFVYISKMIKGTDYNIYSEEEVHAELCYAECLLMMALLTFVADQSLVNFVKGGLRVRACYQAYKECLQILENRIWENEDRRRHYESGTRMGLGIFNLVISHLPARVTRLLEIIGFSGNRAWGLQQLTDSVSLTNTIRGPLGALLLVTYHTVITYLFGICDGDVDHSETTLKELLKKYPRGALFLFFYGRVLQVKGQFDEAITIFMKSITVQEEWKQIRYLGYWEVMWCHCINFNWKEASKCLDFLRNNCRWSPAIYTFFYATILYVIMEEENRPELMDEIVELMKKVPSLKQKMAGKSFPAEKFVVAKSQKFLLQNNRLLLPTLESAYTWNNFPTFRNNPEVIQRVLSRIDKHMPKIENKKEIPDDIIEDYCLGILLRGMCLKYQGQALQAEDCFREIISYDQRLDTDIYLAACATAEMGYICMEQQKYEEALEWLENARHNYENYSLESLLHYRLHAAIRHIRTVMPSSNGSLPSTPTTPDVCSPPGNGYSYSQSSPAFFSSEEKNIYQPPIFKEGSSVVS